MMTNLTYFTCKAKDYLNPYDLLCYLCCPERPVNDRNRKDNRNSLYLLTYKKEVHYEN